jgi:hypothetical protein
MFKFDLKKKFNRYFPSVRRAAFLIVLPAVVIVVIYFFSILTEIATHKKKQDPVIKYENRFAVLRQDIPVGAVVNYVSNHKERTDFVMARYASIPVRIIQGRTPMHNYLVAHYLDPNQVPEFEGYAVEKNYGNGVILYKRSDH